ncbi:uncharacterized protein LOC133302855 [Gastrolobium bilobum]|uniref:uncharacterized protein LOC133302855 n=1 Tax=Gastrolobium bilobum TaxID=150636 RepID=UPI002AB0828B|nr:uncharacterized protein LOC133302855 [Gastrolobium bilobum]
MGATYMARGGGGGGVTRFLPGFRRDIGCERLNFASYAEQPDTSYGDVEFEFLGDGEMSLAKSESSNEFNLNEMELEEDDGESVKNSSINDNRSFWDNQHQVLQTNLCRTSSAELRIRNATKEAVQDIQSAEETVCSCSVRQVSCRNCAMREVSRRLQKAGYNSAICKTKWRSSPSVPSGEHAFLDVIESTSKKEGDVRVIIELNFRAEFEMARASEDYNKLVRRLPEIFVGKVERLSNLIKILCMATKRCTKENKMHMGPWRKHKYMQAKWLGPCKRNTSTTSLSMGYSKEMPKPKPKASLLTVDLLEKLPNMHSTAVKVV